MPHSRSRGSLGTRDPRAAQQSGRVWRRSRWAESSPLPPPQRAPGRSRVRQGGAGPRGVVCARPRPQVRAVLGPQAASILPEQGKEAKGPSVAGGGYSRRLEVGEEPVLPTASRDRSCPAPHSWGGDLPKPPPAQCTLLSDCVH